MIAPSPNDQTIDNPQNMTMAATTGGVYPQVSDS